jgi:hypothetical protein
MTKPPVPILFLYDPAEFWEQVRQLAREEIVQALVDPAPGHPAFARTGVGVKRVYPGEEVRVLFGITAKELATWVREGLLKPVVVRGEGRFLHGDIVALLQAREPQ